MVGRLSLADSPWAGIEVINRAYREADPDVVTFDDGAGSSLEATLVPHHEADCADMRRRACVGILASVSLSLGCAAPSGQGSAETVPPSPSESASSLQPQLEAEVSDPALSTGTIAQVESCPELVPTDPKLLGPNPVILGRGKSSTFCAFHPDRNTFHELPEPPLLVDIAFNLRPKGAPHRYAEIEAAFDEDPRLLASRIGETVLGVEEVDAPGWTFGYATRSRTSEGLEAARASLVFLTESGGLNCDGTRDPLVAADWDRQALASLLAYCGSIKEALWRP